MSDRYQASQQRTENLEPVQDLLLVHHIARHLPRLDKYWSCPPYCSCPLRCLLDWLAISSSEEDFIDVKPLKSRIYHFLWSGGLNKKVNLLKDEDAVLF